MGKYTVTIFDQEQYDESLRLYGDEKKSALRTNSSVPSLEQTNNTKPSFAKQKPQARYNWIHKLDQSLNVTPTGGVKTWESQVSEVRNFIEAREKEDISSAISSLPTRR